MASESITIPTEQAVLVGFYITIQGAKQRKVVGRWTSADACSIMTKSKHDELGENAPLEPCYQIHGSGADTHECIGTMTHKIRYCGQQRMVVVSFCIVDDDRVPPVLLAGESLRPNRTKGAGDNCPGRTKSDYSAKVLKPITVRKESKEDREKREAKRTREDEDKPEDEEEREKRRKKRHEQDKASKASDNTSSK